MDIGTLYLIFGVIIGIAIVVFTAIENANNLPEIAFMEILIATLFAFVMVFVWLPVLAFVAFILSVQALGTYIGRKIYK